MEMCRACLSTTVGLIKLDQNIIEDYQTLTNISVEKTDGLPQSLCSPCKDAISFYATFRSKCIESEAALKQMLSDQLVKSEELKALSEFPHEVKQEDEFMSNYLDDDCGYFDNLDEKVKIEVEDFTDLKPKKRKSKSLKKKDKKVKKIKESGKPEENGKLKFYVCGLCPQELKTKRKFADHLENHSKVNGKCEICGRNFHNWETLFAHRVNHVAAEQMVCHLCERKFTMEVTLENHYLRDHSGKALSLACSWCSRVFATRRKLNKHVVLHSDRTYICDYCTKTFNSKSHLSVHIGKHMTTKPFACKLCNKRFTYPNGLMLHKKRMHTSGLYCKVCCKVYATQALLDAHSCRNKKIVCSICGKLFFHMGVLRDHMRSHSSERPFKCDLCSASYKSRGALQTHKNRHVGLRPFKCSHCAAGFYSQCVLIKHTRIHTGEKPYVCRECGKGFTGGHNLKVHMKVHGEMLVVSRKERPSPDY